MNSKDWDIFLVDDIKKKYFNKIYKSILNGRIDSWAFLWLLFGVINKSKFIVPKQTIVVNNGLDFRGKLCSK